MNKENLDVRMAFLDRTYKEVAEAIRARGIVNTREHEIHEVKREGTSRTRFRTIWNEVDIVTRKWLNEKHEDVRARAADILRAKNVIGDDYDEYDLDVLLCEDSYVFVYEGDTFVALVNLEMGAVMMNGKKK